MIVKPARSFADLPALLVRFDEDVPAAERARFAEMLRGVLQRAEGQGIMPILCTDSRVHIERLDLRPWPPEDGHYVTAESGLVLPDPWDCVYCGSLNAGDKDRCHSCGAPKPARVTYTTRQVVKSNLHAYSALTLNERRADLGLPELERFQQEYLAAAYGIPGGLLHDPQADLAQSRFARWMLWRERWRTWRGKVRRFFKKLLGGHRC